MEDVDYYIEYNEDLIYFMSYARLPENIPACIHNGYIGVGMIINHKTGIINGVTSTLVTKELRGFLNSLSKGYNVKNNGMEGLVRNIENKLNIASQKAICTALNENFRKYERWLLKYNNGSQCKNHEL